MYKRVSSTGTGGLRGRWWGELAFWCLHPAVSKESCLFLYANGCPVWYNLYKLKCVTFKCISRRMWTVAYSHAAVMTSNMDDFQCSGTFLSSLVFHSVPHAAHEEDDVDRVTTAWPSLLWGALAHQQSWIVWCAAVCLTQHTCLSLNIKALNFILVGGVGLAVFYCHIAFLVWFYSAACLFFSVTYAELFSVLS